MSLGKKKVVKKKKLFKKEDHNNKDDQDLGKFEKYIIRDKNEGNPVCGLRYEVDKNEILIGGPKSQMDEVWHVLTMLDSKYYAKALPEDDDQYRVDGSRFRIRVNTTPSHWKEFFSRLNRIYDIQSVKNFRRLMG